MIYIVIYSKVSGLRPETFCVKVLYCDLTRIDNKGGLIVLKYKWGLHYEQSYILGFSRYISV